MLCLTGFGQVQNHLNNNNDQSRTFYKVTNANSLNGGLRFGIKAGDSGGNPGFILLKENKHLFFSTNNLERMRILNTGQVGIGITSPTEFIDVNGNARFRQISFGTNDFITTNESNGTLHKIAFTGNPNDVLLGNGTFGTINSSGSDNDWQVIGSDMQSIPTGNVSIGTAPISLYKFYTSSNNDNVSAAGAFYKLSSANQVGTSIGVFGLSKDSRAAGIGVKAQAQTSEVGGSSTGVSATSLGDCQSITGVRASTSGSASIIGIGTQSISAVNTPVQYGVQSTSGLANLTSNFNCGIRSIGYGNDLTAGSANYGVHATANPGKLTSTNIAVSATAQRPPSNIAGSPDVNYGIYASADNDGLVNCAGFFNGDICGSGMFTYSDAKLKTNLSSLDNALDVINKLQPKKYTFKKEEYKRIMFPEGEQIGLIAQELERVLPNLVTTKAIPANYDDKGNKIEDVFKFKTVNYTALIPVLIQGMKEQQELIEEQAEKIDELEEVKKELAEIKKMLQNRTNTSSIILDDRQEIILNQNQPNPFKEKTTITYFIPKGIEKAEIAIYDFAGKLVKKETIKSGNGEIDVYATNLKDGVFTYAIIANGEIVNSKKMLLNK